MFECLTIELDLIHEQMVYNKQKLLYIFTTGELSLIEIFTIPPLWCLFFLYYRGIHVNNHRNKYMHIQILKVCTITAKIIRLV